MTATWPRLTWREWLRHPVVIALLISVLLHAYVWLMAVVIDRAFSNGWLPDWLKPLVQPAQALLAKPPEKSAENKPAEQGWEEIPLQFIEVDPALVTEETPKDAKFYSTANTLAANPNPAKEAQQDPRIEGFEDHGKTFETRRPLEKPLPAQPKNTVAEELAAVPEQTAKPLKPARQAEEERGVKPGETLLAKVDPRSQELTPRPKQTPQEAQEQQAEKRPRRKTVAEVRQEKGMLVAPKMKLNGNVPRVNLDSSLNVKASPLGQYNYRMVQAVQTRWYQLLDDRKFAFERSGQVVIKFQLHSDGTVTDVRTVQAIKDDEMLSFLCELSIMQPASYGKWPSDMSTLIGRDAFEVTFTFNYY